MPKKRARMTLQPRKCPFCYSAVVKRKCVNCGAQFAITSFEKKSKPKKLKDNLDGLGAYARKKK